MGEEISWVGRELAYDKHKQGKISCWTIPAPVYKYISFKSDKNVFLSLQLLRWVY